MIITGDKVYKGVVIFSTLFLLFILAWDLYSGKTENSVLLFCIITSNILLYPLVMKKKKKSQ